MRSSKKGDKATRTHVPEKHEWHALPREAVFEALGSNDEGLSPEEADRRLGVYGKNAFTQKQERTFIHRLYDQLRSPLTFILIIAFLITLVLEEYVDAIVIALALSIAVILGIVQEGKASRAFDRLRRSQVQKAIVVRAGKKHEIMAAELVPGDVVILKDGMKVPADIRVLEEKDLAVNEAPLTGEWMTVNKDVHRVPVGTPLAETKSMAYMGTYIAKGHGTGIVVATGDGTVVGGLAGDVQAIEDEKTPLQHEMENISRVMFGIILALVVGIFAIGIMRGEGFESMLLTSIAIAVASIPEGLPAAVTIILAVGMEALLKRGGLVRNLLAAETLGSTTYVMTDKTGTLTQARMAITDAVYRGCERDAAGNNTCDWDHDEHAQRIFDVALCASDAYLDERTNGEEAYIVRGEPMERAILESAHELGLTLGGESARGRRVDYLAFTSENRFAAGLAEGGKKHQLCVNGAPELLLAASSHVDTPEGVTDMSDPDRAFFEDEILRQTKEGRRIIAVGYKMVSYDDIPNETDGLIQKLTFMGLLVFHDPVREDVKEAIRGVQDAGAKIRLVTGDNPETALSVARAVGIARKHDVALLGDDIAELDDRELLEVIETTHVFARVLPRQKMRLATVLQAKGEVVAMTGDGINDAPALRKANIGVAIGSGTEVAKEASDLVLVNDTFSTIYAAIEEGRRIIANLRKIVGYLLSTSLAEAVLIAGALVTAGPIPILPAQILWANIIEEGLMSVAFAFEKGHKHAMKQKPRDIHEEGVLSKDMLFFVALVVSVLGMLLLTLYAYLRIIDVSLEHMRSVMFLAIAIDSLFIAFSFRSLRVPAWKVSLSDNWFFFLSFGVNVLLLVIVITVPYFHVLLSYTPLPLELFILPVIYGISTFIVTEVAKRVFFVRKAN